MDAAYVDVDSQRLVALQPKAHFLPLLAAGLQEHLHLFIAELVEAIASFVAEHARRHI